MEHSELKNRLREKIFLYKLQGYSLFILQPINNRGSVEVIGLVYGDHMYAIGSSNSEALDLILSDEILTMLDDERCKFAMSQSVKEFLNKAIWLKHINIFLETSICNNMCREYSPCSSVE